MSKITDAVRERVAFELFLLIRAEGDFDSLSLESAYATWQFEGKPFRDTAKKILSIRLNDKGEPDPEGRYAVKVVDLAEKLPDMELYYEGKKLYFHPESIEAQYYKLAQQDMLSAGFVKEIKEND